MQIPGGREKLLVDGAPLDKRRDLRRGEASLELLSGRKHPALAECGTQTLEIQSPFLSSSRTCFANASKFSIATTRPSR
jgi:hypothetical protein